MLGPGQGAFDNLPKSTCHRPEHRSHVPRSKNILYFMMDTCSLSKKEMHPSLQIYPMDNSDLVIYWKIYNLHASAETLVIRMDPSWVLVVVLLSGRITLICC